MDINTFHNKTLALLIWKLRTSSSKEDEVSMYSGIMRVRDDSVIFDRGEKGSSLSLKKEWLKRIKKIPRDLRKTLEGNEYQLSLTLGKLPPGEKGEGYLSTGLKWLD
jgi:hypothetical protein